MYGSKHKNINYPYYVFNHNEIEENPHYNREQAEQIIENLIVEGLPLERFVAKLARENILTDAGVDQDLVEKFFKKAIGGKYYNTYITHHQKTHNPYGLEIYKKRFLK